MDRIETKKRAADLIPGDEVSGVCLVLWRTPGLDSDGEVEAMVRMTDGGVTWRYWPSTRIIEVLPDAADEAYRAVIEALSSATTAERATSLFKRI